MPGQPDEHPRPRVQRWGSCRVLLLQAGLGSVALIGGLWLAQSDLSWGLVGWPLVIWGFLAIAGAAGALATALLYGGGKG
jgi:hypothetical protein